MPVKKIDDSGLEEDYRIPSQEELDKYLEEHPELKETDEPDKALSGV